MLNPFKGVFDSYIISCASGMQNLTNLIRSINSLEKLFQRVNDVDFMAQQDEVVRLGLQAGLIQNLEFTYELCWKNIKRWIEQNLQPNEADGVTRRELYRIAAENKLIDDVNLWMDFHQARHETSHRYDAVLAVEVMQIIGAFIIATKNLQTKLQMHND
ncbi:MAG: HI0074 family nucleotidyltransferase substrate-binding subunit [Chloroflexota bacterium]